MHLQPAQPAIVVNKSQLPEFVHEEIHAASGGPYQLGQSLLRYFGHYRFRLAFFPVTGKY